MANLPQITAKKLITNQTGIVLITVMIMLLITSMLAASLLKTSLMTNKINLLKQQQHLAFKLAIKQLRALEANNLVNQLPQDNLNHLTTDITTIDAGICGVDFYKIMITANYHHASSTIQSIWALPNHYYQTCHPQAKIRPGRQSFLLIK